MELRHEDTGTRRHGDTEIGRSSPCHPVTASPLLLVLGLGNPLRGDDGIGPRVVELLQRRGLPDGVEVLDAGAAGLDLLNLLEGPRRVIIVDAVDMGLDPGQFARLVPAESPRKERRTGRALCGDVTHLMGAAGRHSPHSAGLAEVLDLARALKRPLAEITIFGVQPGTMEWGEGLTPAVEEVLPNLMEALLREVEDERRTMPATILVIEDSPDMALALRLPLEANGYTVFHALSGQEGLDMVPTVKPDLIILDVMMETTTAGFQVSLQLRSPDPRSEYADYRHVPILMLTAIHTTTSLRFAPDEAYLPVDDFVEKPIDPDVLLAKVEGLIGRARDVA